MYPFIFLSKSFNTSICKLTECKFVQFDKINDPLTSIKADNRLMSTNHFITIAYTFI